MGGGGRRRRRGEKNRFVAIFSGEPGRYSGCLKINALGPAGEIDGSEMDGGLGRMEDAWQEAKRLKSR